MLPLNVNAEAQLQKVRNWLQNHAQKTKGVRLPVHINQKFTPRHVFAIKNEQMIRDKVNAQASRSGDDDDNLDDHHDKHGDQHDEHHADDPVRIVEWNRTVKALWEELSEEEQDMYARVVEKCNLNGPEDDMKP